MEVQEIINQLQRMANEKYKTNVVKMGIPEANSIGVSTTEIRKLAKTIEKSNDLAYALWESGYHEARLLAVLVFDKKTISIRKAGKLMDDVISWDLCDHLCKNLLVKIKGFTELIQSWVVSKDTYKKRGAFTLMVADVIHNKKITEDTIDEYLDMVRNYSDDERDHVKKAISWALREIGKKDFTENEKAIVLAHELKEGSKPQQWIAKDALKELENVVKVEGRGRLISADSMMGKEKDA